MPPLISVIYAKEEISRLLINFFCLTIPKKFVATIRCKKKLRVSKKNLHRGISRFSDGEVLSHSTEKLRRRTLPYFKKFLVSKSFTPKGGGHQGLAEIFFCFTGPKNFVRDPLCVSKHFYCEKNDG